MLVKLQLTDEQKKWGRSITWNDLTRSQRHTARNELFAWVKELRLVRDDMEYKAWRKLTNKKNRASTKIGSPWAINIDNSYAIYDDIQLLYAGNGMFQFMLVDSVNYNLQLIDLIKALGAK